jgi:alpha-glucosidase
MRKLLPLLALLMTLFTAHAAENSHVLVSPDGKLTLTLRHTAEDGLRFAFEADGRELMRPSPIGHAAGGAPVTGTWAGIATRSVDEVWTPLWGKRAEVPDRFNEATVDLTDFKVVARVYDDGITLRSGRPDATGLEERTRFEFAGDYTAWFYNGEQHNIGPEKLSASEGRRLPVMTVKAAEDAYLAIHEADLAEGDPLVLESKAGETAFRVASAPNNAWRVILFGRTPGAMVDSHLIELLNPPPADGADFSWVKPGIAVWDWRINGAEVEGFRYDMSLPSWIRMVDFAAENGIGQLVLDADWYGPEHESQSDPVKGGKVEQVKRILAYGKEKGVGVWLYLNDVAGRQFPLEQTLRQYSEWGAVGIKYGFMRGSATERNARTRLITERAAAHRLMVNFHDNPVHPSGQMRTFPNAVTREYCHSQLDAHRVYQPKTFVTSVFVNMLAGPIDMCNGLADLTQAKRVDEPSPVPSTLAGEGARTLIVFSGSTVIPDIPENYRKHPEILEFISAQKMPWRESRTLSGVIGEHIVMARQAADGVWLVGAATNEEPRELEVPLDFLTPGTFEALIIQDGPGADYRTHVESYRAETREVTATDRITLKLAPGGGACVLLRVAR